MTALAAAPLQAKGAHGKGGRQGVAARGGAIQGRERRARRAEPGAGPAPRACWVQGKCLLGRTYESRVPLAFPAEHLDHQILAARGELVVALEALRDGARDKLLRECSRDGGGAALHHLKRAPWLAPVELLRMLAIFSLTQQVVRGGADQI